MSDLFFTRFQINPRRRATLRLLASPQRLHAAVLSAYPPEVQAGSDGVRLLWRLDSPSRHELNLFVVGPGRPSLEQLQGECGWSEQRSWRTAVYTPFLARLEEGQQWVFRLTANPTRSIAGERGSRGAVSAHVTAEQQLSWLAQRQQRHGFEVVSRDDEPQVRVSRRERATFSKGAAGGGARVTLTRVQYDGVLRVTEPDVLRTSLTHGIGRAKAYGCGLMTLARAQ